MLTLKIVYIIAVRGCRFEYSDTWNRSMPQRSMPSKIFARSSSFGVSTPKRGIFVKLLACVSVGLRTPVICDMARTGEVLLATAAVTIFDRSKVILLSIGEPIIKPLVDPGEIVAELCFDTSSVPRSSSSGLSAVKGQNSFCWIFYDSYNNLPKNVLNMYSDISLLPPLVSEKWLSSLLSMRRNLMVAMSPTDRCAWIVSSCSRHQSSSSSVSPASLVIESSTLVVVVLVWLCSCFICWICCCCCNDCV